MSMLERRKTENERTKIKNGEEQDLGGAAGGGLGGEGVGFGGLGGESTRGRTSEIAEHTGSGKILRTTYGPLTDHLRTTYGPPKMRLVFPHFYQAGAYGPLTDHLRTTYGTLTDHLRTPYGGIRWSSGRGGVGPGRGAFGQTTGAGDPEGNTTPERPAPDGLVTPPLVLGHPPCHPLASPKNTT